MKVSRTLVTTITALALALGSPAWAHRGGASVLSEISMLPVAVSVAIPVGLVMSAAAFTVVAVETVSEGTVWVLERISDGAAFTVTLSAGVVAGVSVGVGAAVTAVACSGGWVLSTAGRAVGFIPNERGRVLMHNEQVTR